MSLRAIFSYRNLDSTADLNNRWAPLFNKGFFDGGAITPIPSQLKVSIAPFKAMSQDGMVVIENVNTELTVIAGQTNYLCLRAIYNSAAVPTLDWLVLEASVYAAHPQIDNLIVHAVVTVPSIATAVTSGMISQTTANRVDKLGRLNTRGVLTNTSQLPASDNRVGDAYFVTSGLGDVPNLYVFNGLVFTNVTQAGSVSSTLTLHRQNLFSNEIHLTDDQAAALIGTSGNPPTLLNPYIDNADTRIPTQGENDALEPSGKTILDPTTVLPSSTNPYMQSSREWAVPEEKVFASGVGTVVEIDLLDGPIWVGTGSDDVSAFNLINLYNADQNIDEEYINSVGVIPRIKNIWLDAGLTTLLTPNTMTIPPLQVAPAGFFLTGSLFFEFDQPIDTAFRFSYLRKYNFASMPPDAFARRKPSDAQVDARIAVSEKTQQFYLSSPTDTITLDPLIFDMIPVSTVHDVQVLENGVALQPDDSYFTPIVIVAGVNDKIDFIDTASIQKTATIIPGTYANFAQLTSLANIITLAMSSITTDTITCTYADYRFTFIDAMGPFTLNWLTGPNAIKTSGYYLGFDVSVDLTGSDTYVSTNFINRGYVEWYKQSSTVVKLIRSAKANGLISVKKIFNLK